MSYVPNARRRRVGAVLIVLGLAAATLAIMPVAAAADTTVQVTQYPGTSSYFDVSLGGGPSRPGFCVALSVLIWVGPVYEANLYSIETLPPGWVVRQDHLDEVNWVLNHSTGYTAEEVQNAIWVLTDGYAGAPDRSKALAASAPDGFVPGCGEYYLGLVAPFSGATKYQTLIVINQKSACHLTVVKEVVTHGGTALPSAWTMNVSAVSPSAASFPGAGLPGTTITLSPGPFSVTESGGPAGYHQAGATGCSGTAFEGDYTCTITNEQDAGRIIVDKVTVPEGSRQQFEFDPSWGVDFALAAGDQPYDSGYLAPGEYSVAEVLPLPADWYNTSAECSTGPEGPVMPPDGIELGAGETVTCVFVNEYLPRPEPGRIIVRKVTSPADAPGESFTFDPSWPGANFPLANGGSHDSGLLSAGVYSVAELGPLGEGWSLASATCDDGSSPASIGLSPGETVTCTFNNAYDPAEEEPTGSLTVVKSTTPAGGAGFPFDAGALGTFSLGDGGSQVFAELAAGPYPVTETPAEGWEFESVACTTVPGAVVDYEPVGSGVMVNLAEGQDVTCTFTNRAEETGGRKGSLTIIKQTTPAGGTGFSFDAGALGTFSLGDGGSQVFAELAAGPYPVTETPAEGWEFESVACTTVPGAVVDYEPVGSGVMVNLAEGQDVTCTFTNRSEETGSPGELPYTGSQPFTMPLLIAGLWAMLMGLGMVVSSHMRRVGS